MKDLCPQEIIGLVTSIFLVQIRGIDPSFHSNLSKGSNTF